MKMKHEVMVRKTFLDGKRVHEHLRRIIRSWQLYVLLALPFLSLIIFEYIPMYGILIAFKEYKVSRGIWGSPWVGFKYFEMFFTSPSFSQLLRNTLTLSLYDFLASFSFPIVLALMLNEIKSMAFKKFVQTVTYIPYFLSTVVVIGLVMQVFSYGGIMNSILHAIGLAKVDYLSKPMMFQHLYVWSGIWQRTGYAAIIYIAALASVDTSLYEAALLDGASRLKKIIYIDIPSILPVIVILFILNAGHILSVGFEKAYLLQNPVNTSVSEVISTYVYKIGLQNAQYSFGTAVGLFNAVVSLVMIIGVNWIARRVNETSLW
ncbi:ABC transporter permease [Paenibacillus koleovorans]|uniref:ABC transporter permease n=1 Tax=Paenibacillus koleovorans TaxID=121608 RepID=UPI001FEB68F9|nr:ABC transporter permease subunit [Paenibacillus koleovorans]